jgi:hypothetical protein
MLLLPFGSCFFGCFSGLVTESLVEVLAPRSNFATVFSHGFDKFFCQLPTLFGFAFSSFLARLKACVNLA